MAFTTSTELAAYTRLQTNLRAGLNFFSNRWHYEAKDWVTCVHAADINQDGDTEVLAGSRDGRVTALSKEGSILWEKTVGDKSWVTAVVAYTATAGQKVACAVSTRSGKIYVFDQDGNSLLAPNVQLDAPLLPPNVQPEAPVHWYSVNAPIAQMRPDPSRPLSVVFAAENYKVYSLDLLTNQLRWSYSARARVRDVFACDINKDGFAETLIGSDDHHLYVLSRDGKLLSSCRLEQAIYTLYAADIDQDGEIEILASTRTKKLFTLTSDLQRKWFYRLSSRLLAIAVADVNDDRQLEILLSCDDQSLTILDNMGKLTWRQKTVNKRYYSLNAFDLDRDGHMELLVGADDSKVYALGVQVTKDLNKRIFRDYHRHLRKPEITTLLDLTNDQLNLLLGVLGFNYGMIDKELNLAYAREQMASEDWSGALFTLLKLEKQRFQMLWEKEELGFRRALCLMDLKGDQQSKVVVSSRDGGISVFTSKGRQLWSERAADGSEIVDVQPGFLSAGHSEDLVYVSNNGALSVLTGDRKRTESGVHFSEQASCFYVLAPGSPTTSEILIGTKSGEAHLYTSDFEKPAQNFVFASAVDRVYISEPDERGLYRSPELLISTSDNKLYAYSRGGNCLWSYETRDQIRALYVKDLDNDGHLEVLIGLDDRNVYVLDDNGVLRWRYVLYHAVLALETADLDGDGKQEILAGCADGVLYVFTSSGDLIWRYTSKDRIQALRVADLDQDGNFEVAIVEEGHLEVLRVVRQKELDELLAECWQHLLAERDPFEAFYSLLKGNDPYLRAASLLKLSNIPSLTPEAMELLSEAVTDAFTDVRKALPEALMNAYPVNPTLTRSKLNILFTDRQREVSIEVVEHLEILAKHDWNTVVSYLERALRSEDRNTRRAALRKIARLIREYAVELRNSRETLGESLFQLLISGALDKVPRPSVWVKQEAGRVLADFLNLFHEHFLPYLYRMFYARLDYESLLYVSANLADAAIRQAVTGLVNLSLHFDFQQAPEMLAQTASALEQVKSFVDGTDLWLIYRELQALFSYSTVEKLAPYDFHLKAEQFPQTYNQLPAFLRIGEHISTVTRPLKTYVRRTDPADRLNNLLDSINSLETLQRVLDREYNVSPLPDAPLPLLPEFVALKALVARWQELFSGQRNELRGHADLKCQLQSRTVRWEESVGIWLQISNEGRALARDVQVTLLADESYIRQSSLTFTANIVQIEQEIVAEFVIKPLKAPACLSFEIVYDNSELEVRDVYDAQLEFVESHQSFTEIENPYVTGSPITSSEMFYGREDDLTFLIDNLIRTNAQTVLVLYGQRRSGKTTLLNQLISPSLLVQHIAVKIDLQKMVIDLTINKFLFKCAQEISKTLLERGLSLPTLQKADFIGPSADAPEAFEAFLDEVKKTLGERRLILLFDEFEELEEQVKQGSLTPYIFKYMRSLVQERHNFHFLFSGTHQIHELTRSYWSVFFQLARHYRLPNKITIRGAEDLITRPVPNLEYEPLALKKIRLLTADQPYLINLVCYDLVVHCNRLKKNYVTINDVNLVQRNVLETGAIHFAWLWDDKLATHEQQLLLLLIAEACKDEGRQLDLIDICSLYENYGIGMHPDTIVPVINALVVEDIIERTDMGGQEGVQESARYTLANGLLRHWLRQKKSIHKLLQEMRAQPGRPGELEMGPKADEGSQKNIHSAVSNGSGEYSERKGSSQNGTPGAAGNKLEPESSSEAASLKNGLR